jgi:hypothetical protein
MSRRLQGRLNITSAAFAACLGLAASKPAFGQQAVQWRIQDGGNGHWYIATTQAFPDFWTAHQVADSRGGHLVTITSEQENSFVAALAPGDFMLGGYQDLLAPNYAEPGGGWRWVTNEPWQFTAWNSLWVDEPNNGGSAGLDGEHYLQWWRFGDPWRSRWNDGGNDLSPSWWDRPAIFEWSADCNDDGIVDYGQVRDGSLQDADGDEIPDCCEYGTLCPEPRMAGPVTVWGNNNWGQSALPQGLGACREVMGGDSHSFAIRADGTVVAWGVNNFGQSTVPASVGLCHLLGSGVGSSSVIRADGSVVVWGMNTQGQANMPSDLGPCMMVDGTYHYVALRYDRSVRAWGWNSHGQRNVPADLGACAFVAAGERHSMAIRVGGTVVSWGANDSGQLNAPSGLGACRAVDGGVGHTLALRSDGSVLAWGRNSDGECNVPPDLGPCTAIAAGAFHSLALRSNGTVMAWGRNAEGQCNVPSNLGRVLKIASGGYHCLVLEQPCPGDLNGSNTVDAEDLAYVLFAWGTNGGKTPEADIDRSGTVDANDLSVVLGSWGPCPN